MEKQPEPMKESEQRTLAFHFQTLTGKIAALLAETQGMTKKYPGLSQETMYLALTSGLQQACENALGLEDYLVHATDENWRVDRTMTANDPQN